MYESQCYICIGENEDLPIEQIEPHYHRYGFKGLGRVFIKGIWDLPNPVTIDYLATYHKQWIEAADEKESS